MEFNDKGILILFGIAVLGILFFTITAVLMRNSPKRKRKLEDLRLKQGILKEEYRQMNIQRVELLNKMYHNGEISRMNYELEFKKIIKDLREVGLEEEFLDFIREFEIK